MIAVCSPISSLAALCGLLATLCYAASAETAAATRMTVPIIFCMYQKLTRDTSLEASCRGKLRSPPETSVIIGIFPKAGRNAKPGLFRFLLRRVIRRQTCCWRSPALACLAASCSTEASVPKREAVTDPQVAERSSIEASVPKWEAVTDPQRAERSSMEASVPKWEAVTDPQRAERSSLEAPVPKWEAVTDPQRAVRSSMPAWPYSDKGGGCIIGVSWCTVSCVRGAKISQHCRCTVKPDLVTVPIIFCMYQTLTRDASLEASCRGKLRSPPENSVQLFR